MEGCSKCHFGYHPISYMFFPNYSNAKVRYKSVSISRSISWSVQSFNPRIQIKRNSRILIKKSSVGPADSKRDTLLKIIPQRVHSNVIFTFYTVIIGIKFWAYNFRKNLKPLKMRKIASEWIFGTFSTFFGIYKKRFWMWRNKLERAYLN